MKQKIIIFLLALTLITACSSVKGQEEVTYTITDGLKLRFEMKSKDNGWLYINGEQDSIPFNYSLIKSKKKVLENKTANYKKITFYEYKILYPELIFIKYPILSKFKTLPALKTQSIFIYESHTGSIPDLRSVPEKP
jgi:hypothetical protein